MRAPRSVPGFRISTLLVSLTLAAGLVATTQLGCSSGGGGSEGSGGTTGSGGTSSSGGQIGSGGASSGGTNGSGGKVGTGGTTGSGGSATGGSTGSGGTASGGATGSGGAASGGTTGSGGAAAGGGGAAIGGAAGHAAGGQPGHGGGQATGGQGGRANGSGGIGGAAPKDTGGAGVLPLNMNLTSTQVTEGSSFPAGITCADSGMGSPDFTWTAGPSGTMSYAITLTDLTLNGLVHWAIWNIPSTTTMLPAKLATTTMLTMPAGAQQVAIQGNGYFGPCPMGSTHTYQFRVYAIGAATLPGAAPTTAANAKAAIIQNATGSGTLTGTSNASRM